VSHLDKVALVSIIIKTASDTRRYFRVIRALLLKAETEKRKAPAEALLELAEPVFLVALFTTARHFVEQNGVMLPPPLGDSVVLFYATGFFPKYFFIYISIKRIKGAVSVSHRRFPIERRLDHVVAHIILYSIDYTILGCVLFSLLAAFWVPSAIPSHFAPIMQSLVCLAMMGFGWGILNIVLARSFPLWFYISGAINRTTILISGALFVPDFLNPPVRYVLSFNPELHAIALFRTGFYPYYPTLILDEKYMLHCSLIAVIFGLVLERVTRRAERR
jgi:capsular polysaccharide transport system permease protein